jgi:adenosylcobinamide-phosphate synthase
VTSFIERRKRPALLAMAAGIDSLFGEPRQALHPVVWMGKAISRADGWIKSGDLDRQFRNGAILTAGGAAASFALGTALEIACRSLPAGVLVQAWLLKTCLAWRALDDAALDVQRSMESGDPGGAREKLAALVSRETDSLSEGLIAAATVESVAENFGDSLIGPSMYYLLGGLGGVLAYRWVNTLDSMIGYHGEYEWAGKFAARIDDVLNFVPSRAAALALIAAAPGGKARAVKTMVGDGGLTASPNAGKPMAAMAGLLDRRLEKADHYALNADAPEPTTDDIGRARELLRRAWLLVLAVALVVGKPALKGRS